MLNSTCKNKLINIAPAELENRFNAALHEISTIIMKSYIEQVDNLDIKIKSLNTYIGNDKSITPFEFKGEHIQISDSQPIQTVTSKVKYDM